MSVRKCVINVMPYILVDKFKTKRKNKLSSLEPPIFNNSGTKMQMFYLQDNLCYYFPYSMAPGRFPKYILWDRYNYGLRRHVYTHQDILRTCGKPEKKYALFLESGAILPKDYEIFDKHRNLAREFESVFTHSQKLLNQLENAKWIPGGHVWYGGIGFGGEVSQELYSKKTKNISMVSSDKMLCELHRLRIMTIKKLQGLGLVDGYGTYPGTPNGDTLISETLQDYRFSIVFENNIEDYYFTEKILNCFASMTIPVYLGAKKIADYFNIDGIVQLELKDIDKIENIIRGLNAQYYRERREAIIDNFKRVQKYICLEDYLYNHYLKCEDIKSSY